jgi:F-type H+-transporting ATPase subunit b
MKSHSTIVELLLVALLMFVGANLMAVQAQEPPAPKQSPTKGRHEGVGRQLAHESREAAGEEEDETAEFKQSSSVQLVSRITGLNLQQSYWVCVVLNFVVIAAVIIWAGRKYLPGIFRDRTVAIQRAMQQAQQASEEARRKLAEIESRLASLDAEISAIRSAADKEAVAEEARIKAAAQEDARKIVAAAEQEIAAAVKLARRQLTAHAAELAVSLARKQIRVDPNTDQALVRSFAGQLGTASENQKKDGH